MIVSDRNHSNHCRHGCVLHANHNADVHSKESANILLSLNRPALLFCFRHERNLCKSLCERTECPFKLNCCCIRCAERCGISSSHLRMTQLHPVIKTGGRFGKLLFLNLNLAAFFHFTSSSLQHYEKPFPNSIEVVCFQGEIYDITQCDKVVMVITV